MKRVSAVEARKMQDEGWTYVDVRTEAEFEGGHPTGSQNFPMNAPTFIEAVKAKFPAKEAKLIIGCQMGGRSAKASAALEAQGYTQLVDATQGFGGWLEAKLPAQKGK